MLDGVWLIMIDEGRMYGVGVQTSLFQCSVLLYNEENEFKLKIQITWMSSRVFPKLSASTLLAVTNDCGNIQIMGTIRQLSRCFNAQQHLWVQVDEDNESWRSGPTGWRAHRCPRDVARSCRLRE